PALLPREDRGPRPRVPGLDGRLEGLLRPFLAGVPPRLRFVRPGVRRLGMRPPGGPEQPDLRLEEPGGTTPGGAPGVASVAAAAGDGRGARGVRDGAGRGPGPARERPAGPPRPGGGPGWLDVPAGGVLPAVWLVSEARAFRGARRTEATDAATV